jgi:hypothetical protein
MKKTLFFSALLGMATLFAACSEDNPEVTLNVSTAAITVEAAQATATFNITSNTDWNLSLSDNWVSAAPSTGSGDATVTVIVQANTTTSPRTALIRVTAGDKNREVTINQAANAGTPTPPAKATIAGKDSNCPEGTPTVTLTATASGATSFIWYNGTNVIAGNTGNTYEVSASGTYYATGVNADGEGAKSNPKTVRLYDDCSDSGDFQYADLLGNYSATGDPSLLQNPGPTTWNTSMVEPDGGRDVYYILSGWGGTNINVGIDIVGSTLVPNTYTMVARNADNTAQGYLCVFHIVQVDDVSDLILMQDYAIQWNGRTQTLDWSGEVSGSEVMMAVLAFDATTGEFLGLFSEAYANLVMTKTGANGSYRMEGTMLEGGVKDPATGLIQHDMFKNIRSVKRVSNLTR